MDLPITTLALIAVFCPLVLSLATLLLPRSAILARTLVSIAAAVISVAALVTIMVTQGFNLPTVAVPFVPTLDISFAFRFDQLGQFFALLVAGMGIFINIYARGYFGRDRDELYRFYPTNGFFMTAMVGVVLSDNLLCLLIFWEMTAISSFLLIGWDREDKTAVKLAMQAFITTALGGLALMAGLILLGLATDEWTISGVLASDLSQVNKGLLNAAFLCMFVGAAAKSAQWPFHYWLPGAMAAPTPVSAYLHSATMVKAGVYLCARLYPAFRHLEIWPYVLIGIGTLTMVMGAYLALRSTDLKKIFAYTTVSQLALFICAYGLGTFDHTSHTDHHAFAPVDGASIVLVSEHNPPIESAADEHAAPASQENMIWPIVQIMNHALYKAPIFIIAGAIGLLAGSRDIRKLGGLLRSHKLLAWLCLAAGYAMAAGPGTLSFNAKEAFLYQIYHAAQEHPIIWFVGAAAVFMALVNVAVFVRLLTTFAGLRGSMEADVQEEEPHHHHEREGGFWGACLWWPAAFLLAFQFIGGIFAGPFSRFVSQIETHPNYWASLPWSWQIHFNTPPIYLSLLAISLGVALALSRVWRTFWKDPHDNLYPGFYWLSVTGGGRAFRTIQTGNFRHYVVFVLLAALAGVIASATIRPELLHWPTGPDVAPIYESWPGLLIAIVICVTALLLPIVQQRVVRVLILGSTGFSVTAMYLLYQAPDLALTQLMFEIISVVLFLLVLRMLPDYNPRPKNFKIVGVRIIVSAAIGLSIGWLTYVAATTDLTGVQKLGDFFIANSYQGTALTHGHGGGGNNIVNVILVDFRGFDTIGEITVLGIAALGVWALLSKRDAEDLDFEPVENALDIPGNGGPGISSLVFRTTQRILLPLSLVFAVYMFIKGHQEPGGGFIAGLIAAVALAIFRMATGPGALLRLLPVKPERLIVLGLGLALLTGTASLLFGLPFFTSAHGYIGSGVNQVEWATVMAFDLGVFLVVTGVSIGMIVRLSEELE